MAGIDDAYARNMHKQRDYFVAWEPTSIYQLGDFGEMDGKVFKKLGTLKDLKIPIKVRTEKTGDMDYQSEGVFITHADVGVQGAGAMKKAEGNLEVKFTQSNGILFKASDITTEYIDNIYDVGDRLVKLYKDKGHDWRLSNVVITELKKADYLLVLISRESGGSVKLSGKVPIKADGVKVADLNIRDLSVSTSSSKVDKYTAKGGSTPLFQLHEVKDPITKSAFFTEYK